MRHENCNWLPDCIPTHAIVILLTPSKTPFQTEVTPAAPAPEDDANNGGVGAEPMETSEQPQTEPDTSSMVHIHE